MSLRDDVPLELRGTQQPRICSVPPYTSTAGAEALRLAEIASLRLDPWQQSVTTETLGESPGWKCPHCVYRLSTTGNAVLACPEHPDAELFHPWSAWDVGLNVPRQNGKGVVLLVRELFGLFILHEGILHTAHEYRTAMDGFKRLTDVVMGCPELRERVGKPGLSHGMEGIKVKAAYGGGEIRFQSRTKGAGRGLSIGCIIFDEAMDISEAELDALLPLASARPNPQIWYAGSAVDQNRDDNGVVFTRVRERGIRGDPVLAYFEWSADLAINEVKPDVVSDPMLWAQANPALGIRIDADYVANERGSMSTRGFAVERLCVGDWPRTEEGPVKVIPTEIWRACEDLDSEEAEDARICFAFDVTPDQSVGTICLSAKRADGLDHIEFIEQDRGMAWIPRRLAELKAKWKPAAIVCDGSGPVGSLLPELASLKIKVIPVTAKEHQQACGMFFTATGAGDDPSTLRHLGQEELDAAVEGAAKRLMGDAWLWDRKNATVDISPLVGCTLALWGSRTQSRAPQVINMADYL